MKYVIVDAIVSLTVGAMSVLIASWIMPPKTALILGIIETVGLFAILLFFQDAHSRIWIEED